MNTCDTCRFWAANEYLGNNLGYCTGLLTRQSGYFVSGHGWVPGRDDDREWDQVVLLSGSHGAATGPKFGCIHWEPKGLQV